MQGSTEKNRSVAQPSAAMFILRGFLFWLLLSLLAVGNGFVGELLVTPRFGAYANHLYKSVLMLVFIRLSLRAFWRWNGLDGWRGRARLLGALWLGLTLAFEFGFFHYVMNQPWELLLAEYRFWRGRLWVLILLAVFFMPYLTAAAAARKADPGY